MNPDDLIKAAPAIAKGVTAVAAAVPFTAIVKRMLGPAADELAEMWRDQVRMYRYERQLNCVQKAERMAQKAGFTPQAVPPKILFPLLEGVSLEEDEGLHDMWSALLANAASPETERIVRPGFIAILKQMAPDEAAILNYIFDEANKPDSRSVNVRSLRAIHHRMRPAEFPMDAPTDLMVCLLSLEADRLITQTAVLVEDDPGPHKDLI